MRAPSETGPTTAYGERDGYYPKRTLIGATAPLSTPLSRTHSAATS
jgi:hypothetical protein